MTERSKPKQKTTRTRPPARTTEQQERRLIALAFDEAEKQLSEGKASNQVITHFLKLGSLKEKKEVLLLEQELKLKRAKTEAIESSKRVEELYSQALDAMRSYAGIKNIEVDDD